MRNFRLFFNGIRNSIRNNPLIYVLFLLFYIFSIISSIYVIGKYSSVLLTYDDYDDSLSTFNIDYGLRSDTSLSEIYDSISENVIDSNVEYIGIRFLDSAFSKEKDAFYYAVCYAKDEGNMISDYLEKAGLENIGANEIADSLNNMILVENSENSDFDNSFEIQEHTYRVIGTVPRDKNGLLFHLVSYKSAVNNNPIIQVVEIKYKNISSYNHMNNIKNKLTSDFPKARITEPVKRDYNVESILSFENILVYFVIILSAVNFIYLFTYILDKRKKQYYIYSLCGCTALKINLFIGLELLLVSLASSILGITLFEFLIKPLIVKFEPVLKYSFHYGLYFAVFVFSIFLGIAVMLTSILYRRKKR